MSSFVYLNLPYYMPQTMRFIWPVFRQITCTAILVLSGALAIPRLAVPLCSSIDPRSDGRCQMYIFFTSKHTSACDPPVKFLPRYQKVLHHEVPPPILHYIAPVQTTPRRHCANRRIVPPAQLVRDARKRSQSGVRFQSWDKREEWPRRIR